MAARNVRVVVEGILTFVEQIVKKITLDVVANLTASPAFGGTPVDTGWARANWLPRIGAEAPGTVGSREQVTEGPQQSSLVAIAAGYKLRQGPIHITNHVPYIIDLNMGSSLQAPVGFVQNAIKKAIRVDLAAGFGL